jgi:hypothetical protein
MYGRHRALWSGGYRELINLGDLLRLGGSLHPASQGVPMVEEVQYTSAEVLAIPYAEDAQGKP